MKFGFKKRGLLFGFEVDTRTYWDAEDDKGQWFRWKNVYRLCPLPFISITWEGRMFSDFHPWDQA